MAGELYFADAKSAATGCGCDMPVRDVLAFKCNNSL